MQYISRRSTDPSPSGEPEAVVHIPMDPLRLLFPAAKTDESLLKATLEGLPIHWSVWNSDGGEAFQFHTRTLAI